MGFDAYNSENCIFTEKQQRWRTRKRKPLEKIKEFLFGKETIERHWNKNGLMYPKDIPVEKLDSHN